MRRFSAAASLVIAFLTLAAVSPAQGDHRVEKNVLILQGHRADLPGLQLIRASLRQMFDREPGLQVNVFTEFLDFPRFPRATHDENMRRYLKEQYAGRRIDLVIPIFGPALEFALDHRESLFPGRPIVFCFVDEREAPMASLPAEVRGVYLHYDFERTLQLATTLQPNAREIVLVSGASEFDHYWADQALRAAAAHAERVPSRKISGSREEILAALRSLARDTIVLYTSVYRDASGHDVIPVDIAGELAAVSNAPVYGTRSNWIDQGIVGGAAFEHAHHGQITGQLALAALKGLKDSPRHPEYEPSPLIVNWKALKKWGIRPALIPAGTEVRFRPPSFWQQYRTIALIILGVVIVQGALIAALLAHRARLRRSEQALDERLEFETQIANAAVELIDLPPNSVDEKVDEILRKAIEVTGLDRSILFEYNPERAVWRITHSVSTDGGIPIKMEIARNEAPFLHEKTREGSAIVLDDVELQLPPEATADRELLRKRGIKSSVVFPISISREAVRGIAFHATRRKITWPEDQLPRLRLVGEIVHSALAAKRSDEALKASEERYREVVESQTELVCRYLPDSTLTFVNEAYCRCFHRRREELIGTPFLELIPESARETTRRKLMSFGKDLRELSYEHEVLLPDGAIGWQQWTDYAFLDESDRVIEFQAIGRDTTVRKRAELALQESRQRMNLAADAANLGFWDFNLATGTLWLSAHARELFSFSATEPVSHNECMARVVHEDRLFVRSIIKQAETNKGDLSFECRVKGPENRFRWINVRGRYRSVEDSDSPEVFGIVMDITTQVEAELQRQAQLSEMTHISRLAVVGELTASIAHEVNQPLAAMLSNTETAEILLGTASPPIADIREILSDIRADNDRASSVIRRLRELLQKRSLEMAALDVNLMITETLHFLSGDARRRGVDIETSLTPELPPIRGDKLHLQQVLLNLVINGMDAMSHLPEPARRIHLASGMFGDGMASVSVRDQGPGIPLERLPRLFDSFFTTKESGVGLGLSIARSIIEAHGGRIWAENAPSGGAVFHISLRTEPVTQ